MTARVEVVENMGSKKYVYITQGGNTMTAEFPADVETEPEQNINVVFDPTNLHLFDAASGNAVAHSRSAVDSTPVVAR
jgi:multiple sugar transport system ATP-binding protein